MRELLHVENILQILTDEGILSQADHLSDAVMNKLIDEFNEYATENGLDTTPRIHSPGG